MNCRTVKGPKEVEPKYYLHVEKTKQHKDTKYNQTFCEDLRGTYDCSDTMTMTCEKRGWSVPWEKEERKMILSLEEVQQGHPQWWYGHYWKSSRYGVYLKTGHETQQSIRKFIAKKLHVKINHIDDIRVEQRGNGKPSHNIREKHYAWESYNVWYRYRDGEETCDKWSKERWDELCIQKR